MVLNLCVSPAYTFYARRLDYLLERLKYRSLGEKRRKKTGSVLTKVPALERNVRVLDHREVCSNTNVPNMFSRRAWCLCTRKSIL